VANSSTLIHGERDAVLVDTLLTTEQSKTLLDWVVASNDKVTVADLALAAYERALEPKRLALIPGGHFDPYLDEFRVAEAAATEWFREHLIHPATSRSEATLLSPDQSRSHHLRDRKRS